MTLLRLATYLTVFIWTAAGSVVLTQWWRPAERALPASGNTYSWEGYHTNALPPTTTWDFTPDDVICKGNEPCKVSPVTVTWPVSVVHREGADRWLPPISIGDEIGIGSDTWFVMSITCEAPEYGQCRAFSLPVLNHVDRSSDGFGMTLIAGDATATVRIELARVFKDDVKRGSVRQYGGNCQCMHLSPDSRWSGIHTRDPRSPQ